MANRVVNSKPGPNGSRLLSDEKGRYLGRSVKNAAGNQVFLDSKGNYAGRCKSGPGNHTIIVPESRPSGTGSTGSASGAGAGSSGNSGYLGFAVLSLLFLLMGGLSAVCLYEELQWGLKVGFLEVAGTVLGLLTLTADILLILALCRKKRQHKEEKGPAGQTKE